ncbi:MAG: NADH:flavin oxidoreductase [Firmicutes bacterium]|nr:NADH:flavin oxidoreductase [Bacillota bacterium]
MVSLLSEFPFKGLTLRNRIAMPPMATGLATESGEVTPALIEHYCRRAASGTGLVIVENAYLDPAGRLGPNQIGVHHDGLVEGLSSLASAVKAEGAAVALQINHAGGSANPPGDLKYRPAGPSAVPNPRDGTVPAEMSAGEIEAVVEGFALAAWRAVAAGFDSVEIHGAHGYLLSQFLSPLTNHRSDEYGGSLENRALLLMEVVRAVRAAVGEAYPLIFRLGAWDGVKGGLMLEHSVAVARDLARAGVDLLDVSGGFCGSRPDFLQGVDGYFIPLAAAIRKEAGAPVLCAGGITEPDYANRLVRYDRVDLVGIGRAMLEDPDWARRAIELAGSRDGGS